MELRHTTPERRAAWRFFLEHAGGVGRIDANGRTAWERGRVALELARAEELLAEALELEAATFELVDDDMPWDEGTETSAEEATRLFASGAWQGPYGLSVTVGDDPGTQAGRRPGAAPWACASLWGVVVGPRGVDDPYVRVVRAELADELADELAGAIARAGVRELAAELAERVGVAAARDLLAGALEEVA